MKSERPSRSGGRLLALRRLAAALAALVSLAPLRAQMSPGPLSRAHAHLDGTLQCFTCHGKGQGSMQQRCLACHREIAWLIEHRRGLHASPGMDACARCHPEHAGRDFGLVRFDEGSPERFDHRRAGWPLEGRHASLGCDACHRSRFRASDALRLAPGKVAERSFLGLERECASCHADVHRATLGSECRGCHGLESWKPAPGFDHARTAYPLTGAHAKVPCARCHRSLPAAAAEPAAAVFGPLAHGECSSCHQDPHAGRLGALCSSCHATASFRAVSARSFDHSRTRYPLRGRHVSVACESCHGPGGVAVPRPRFDACVACHRDPHGGQTAAAGPPRDCALCHSVDGYRPSTFTAESHRTSSYPLEGKHLEVRCEACHPRNPPGTAPESLGKAGVLIRRPHARCGDCHADPHGGQLGDRGACERCHAVAGWRPSTFTAREHASLRLPLEGKHARIPCSACHGPERRELPSLPATEPLGSARVALALGDVACTACHADPHGGRYSAGGAKPRPEGCVACHGLDAFRPSKLDAGAHRDLGSPLEGAHASLACERCHEELGSLPARSSLVGRGPVPLLSFSTKGRRCEDCHVDPHGGQFAGGPRGGSCARCHGERAFRPAERFDHARDSAFRLEGAHARVACDRCHVKRADASGHESVVYRGLPGRCVDCHGARPSSSPDAGRSSIEPPPARGRVG